MGTEDTVEPVRHWHPDLCSPQLLEGLCIQDKQESTLVLQEEEKGRVSAQLNSFALCLHSKAQSRP